MDIFYVLFVFVVIIRNNSRWSIGCVIAVICCERPERKVKLCAIMLRVRKME